jgi:ferredoxin
MSESISVDRLRCDGRGVCADLFPEMISLDDWGYPIVAPTDLPEHQLRAARLAVSRCPVMALRIARRDGEQGRATTTLTAVSQPQVTVV